MHLTGFGTTAAHQNGITAERGVHFVASSGSEVDLYLRSQPTGRPFDVVHVEGIEVERAAGWGHIWFDCVEFHGPEEQRGKAV